MVAYVYLPQREITLTDCLASIPAPRHDQGKQFE